MRYFILCFFISISLLSCLPNTGYRIHNNDSYFPVVQQLSMYGIPLIEEAKSDTLFEIIGIYSSNKAFLSTFPVVRVYKKEIGRTFIPLITPLPCAEGTLIRISGIIQKKPYTFPRIKKTYFYSFLGKNKFEIIKNTEDINKIVNDEYYKIKTHLKKKITLDKSKLEFPERPEWDIWYDEEKNNFVFFCHFYDLMYAAAIEFVVSSDTEKIIDVYARQWFKGEL